MRPGRNRPTGTTLLVPFLAATLGLAAWLALAAASAVRSHRDTAEAALRDYARTATWESGRIARERLDLFLVELFEEAYPRLRRNRSAPPEVVRRELDDALDDEECACPLLRATAGFFHVALFTGETELEPDTFPAASRARITEALAAHIAEVPNRRRGLLVEPGGSADDAHVIAYIIGYDATRTPEFAVGLVSSAPAFGELFAHWYATRPLLPPAITGATPTDSLLRVAVEGPAGTPVLRSPAPFEDGLSARDTLEAAFGGLVIQAAIRQDAAVRLVIGGLPRSNLPLILGLLVLTLGLGVVALVQIRRERQLAALRDDFISGVSHELRTPLAQIRVFADLEESGKLRSDEERRRAIRVINREAARLSHLVENVLRFSRTRRPGPQGRVREPVDLSAAVTEAVEAMRPLAATHRMRIRADVEDDLSALAGRDGVRQILVNLLDNAVKYGPPGEEIRVSATRSQDRVRIAVEDAGPGIPPAERTRIFEPYRRLTRDIDARHPGTGIGLAVVADLVSLYAGDVHVEDARSGGARFVVTLAAADATPTSAPLRVTEGAPA